MFYESIWFQKYLLRLQLVDCLCKASGFLFLNIPEITAWCPWVFLGSQGIPGISVTIQEYLVTSLLSSCCLLYFVVFFRNDNIPCSLSEVFLHQTEDINSFWPFSIEWLPHLTFNLSTLSFLFNFQTSLRLYWTDLHHTRRNVFWILLRSARNPRLVSVAFLAF